MDDTNNKHDQNPSQNNENTIGGDSYTNDLNTSTDDVIFNLNESNENIQFEKPFIISETETYEQQESILSNQNITMPQKMPVKKSKYKFITIVLAVILVLGIGVVAFAFQNSLANTLAMATKSPANYYASIEKKAINNTIDSFISAHTGLPKQTAVNVTTDISFDRNTVSALSSTLGMSLEEVEQLLGIKFETIGLDMTVAFNETNLQEILLLKLNEIDLISLELFFDIIKKELLLRSPELSSSYIRHSLELGEDNPTDKTQIFSDLLAADKTGYFFKTYSNIILDNMNNVELVKDVEFETGNVSETCNKLLVTIDQATLNQILLAILEEAKDDSYIHSVLSVFDITKEEYIQNIETLIAESKDEDTTRLSDKILEMTLYVNNSGEILGRDIVFLDTYSFIGSLGYYNINKKGSSGFYYKDEKGIEIINVTGKKTTRNNASDGSFTISINADVIDSFSDLIIEIEYQNVKTELKNGRKYIYGNYSISSLAMMGTKLLFDFDVADGIQQSLIRLQFGSTSLVTLDTKVKFLDNYNYTLPSISDTIYDFTDMDAFLQTIDTDKLIEDLSNKLGINLEDIIYNFMFNY